MKAIGASKPRPATAGQIKEIKDLLLQALPKDLTYESAQQHIGNKGVFVAQVRTLIQSVAPTDVLAQWTTLYCDLFGLEVDFSGVIIPPKKKDFDRLILVPKGLTLNQTFDVCEGLIPTWRYVNDLDKEVTTNDRDPKLGPYAIWVEDLVESDGYFANVSADEAVTKKFAGITLLEHLLFHIKYFRETGKHLDVVNWTLCTGSFDSDGHVLFVSSLGGMIRIDFRSRFRRSVHSRLRCVVSVSL